MICCPALPRLSLFLVHATTRGKPEEQGSFIQGGKSRIVSFLFII